LHPNCRCYYECRIGPITRKWDDVPAEKRKDFTEEMHDALWEYSSTSYYINTILRYPKDYAKKITYQLQIERAKKAIEILKKIFGLNDSIITEDTILWRGLDEWIIEKMRLSSEDPEYRDILMDPGFSSTSKKKNIAIAFGLKHDESNVTILKIHVPKGTRAIYIGDSYDYKQEEVLLNNGSMYHIKNIEERPPTSDELEIIYSELGLDEETAGRIKIKIYDVDYIGCYE
jgi:hypothetical protein